LKVPVFSILDSAAFRDAIDFGFAFFACFFPFEGDVKASLMLWLEERAFRLRILVADEFAFE
jgi:hypothetical protein